MHMVYDILVVDMVDVYLYEFPLKFIMMTSRTVVELVCMNLAFVCMDQDCFLLLKGIYTIIIALAWEL